MAEKTNEGFHKLASEAVDAIEQPARELKSIVLSGFKTCSKGNSVDTPRLPNGLETAVHSMHLPKINLPNLAEKLDFLVKLTSEDYPRGPR